MSSDARPSERGPGADRVRQRESHGSAARRPRARRGHRRRARASPRCERARGRARVLRQRRRQSDGDAWARRRTPAIRRSAVARCPFPERRYHGDYVRDVAAAIRDREGDRWAAVDPTEARAHMATPPARPCWTRFATTSRCWRSSSTSYVSEKKLRADGAVAATLAQLDERGVVYEHDGCALVRSPTSVTTRTSARQDRAGSSRISAPTSHTIATSSRADSTASSTSGGADHHGHILRMKAALQALGLDANVSRSCWCRSWSLTRAGVPVRMGKRSGSSSRSARSSRRSGPTRRVLSS
jgi:hypothetical protein